MLGLCFRPRTRDSDLVGLLGRVQAEVSVTSRPCATMSRLGYSLAAPNATSAIGSLSRRPPLSQTSVVDPPTLQAASRILQEQAGKDGTAVPDLGELLTIRA